MARAQILMFDKHGLNPFEMDGEVTQMGWSDRSVTEARLTIPLSTANTGKIAFDKSMIARMVYIRGDDIPEWGGVIWTPISFEAGVIKLTAFSGLYYLDGRLPVMTDDKERTAGAAVVYMIRGSKKRGFLPVLALDAYIDKGGDATKGKIRQENTILENMQRISRRNGFEFWLDPELVDGKLRFFLNWGERKRNEGSPIEVGKYGNATWGNPGKVISGNVVSVWFVEERDIPTGDDNRQIIHTTLSKELYGHWEKKLVVEKISAGKAESAEFKRAVEEFAHPVTKYRFRVRLGAGQLSKEVEPGSIHFLNGPGVGFEGGLQGTSTTVRITDTDYQEGRGYVDCIGKEWTDTDKEVLA